jgi:hypothetical protein
MTGNPVGSNSIQATGVQAVIGHGKPALPSSFLKPQTEFATIMETAKPHPVHKMLSKESARAVRRPNQIEKSPTWNNS